MRDTKNKTTQNPLAYRMRMMETVIVAELFFIALFLFWPDQAQEQAYQNFYEAKEETQIQAPVRTRQQSAPPPPPAPTVPIPVPNDQPVQEDIKFPQDIFSNSLDSLSVTAGKGGEGTDRIVGNPEVDPSIVKIEEPTFENRSPEKADIYVKFLVDTEGNVEEAVIDKIFLYDKNGKPTIKVNQLQNKDVVTKTIEAALNWKFRPAKNNGKPVKAYTIQIFTVDY